MPEPTSGATGASFPKDQRLLSRGDFLRAKARGRKVHTEHLLALALPPPASARGRRVGLTVSGKVGNSVERNRVKRWLRQIFRTERDALPDRVDLVLIAKQGAPDADEARLRAEFLEVARKLRQPPSSAAGKKEGR
ncbi:ribonuclease P protein component [Vulgatibacter incomptus]|uniref:Ribonuclease P protein component n=1 Tax=Vulgatibacter incomptus TaxID=1391653 RepID=A0A0K1PH34_9BACT|nr:ribonuclease P protein component [Vulgatibacter incomptus]AKU92848.1 Ribonuclease P protein component [Vulgatibacter incomptus]